jgi:hypothetical protein
MLNKFSMRLFHQGVIAFVATVALFSSGAALAAQVGVVPDSPPVVSASVLAWGSVTALACTFLMNLTAPGTPTPWNWNPQVRWGLALLATTVSGIIHSMQSGVVVQTAIVTAACALLAATLAHFSTPGALAKPAAKVVGAAVLLLALGASVSVPGVARRAEAGVARAATHVQVGGMTGCSVLFPGLTTGTVTSDITAALTVAQTLDGWATTAWSDAQPYIPQVSLTNAQAVWTKAQDVYQAAVTSLQAALAAYTAGTGPSPNWAALLAALTSAADAIVTVIDQFGGSLPGMLATLSTNSEFRVHVASVHATQTTLHTFKAP